MKNFGAFSLTMKSFVFWFGVTTLILDLVNETSSIEIIKAEPLKNSTCEAPIGN